MQDPHYLALGRYLLHQVKIRHICNMYHAKSDIGHAF